MSVIEPKNIAIIGGGASAVAILDQLIKQSIAGGKQNAIGRICLFEKNSHFACGLAYWTPLDNHILNMRNNTMSFDLENKNDFVNFLAQQDDINDVEQGVKGYARRRVFGDYAQAYFQAALTLACQHNVKVETRCLVEVKQIIKCEKRYQITLNDNNQQSFDALFLSIGNQPSAVMSELMGCQGYYPNPYDIERIVTINSDEPVTIIGSGLTAIDVYLTLKTQQHRGWITFVSRRGLLPKIRGNTAPYQLQFLSRSALDKITSGRTKTLSLRFIRRAIFNEMQCAGISRQFILNEYRTFKNQDALTILERDLRAIKTIENSRYLSVLKAVDEVIGDIWQCLSIQDKQYFEKQYRRLWDIYDYPMPAINAEIMLQSFQNGELNNLSGLQSIKQKEQKGAAMFDVCFHHKHHNFTTRCVINATGQSYDITKSSSMLLQQLQTEGLINAHPFGGIDVEFASGQVIGQDKGVLQDFYVIGSLTRGVHFYTNALQENVKAAARAVKHLLVSFAETD